MTTVFTDLASGFALLLGNPAALFFVFLGAFIGIVIGALPGLTAAAAIAMLMPITFYLDPLSALAFLYVIGKSGRYGGSIAAVLFNTPGTAASAATMIDGHPMAKKGQAGKALKISTAASVFGDTFGELVLIFGAASIAVYTARFGPPEYFAVYVMAFVVIGSVIGSSVTKGLMATAFGALVAFVGLDPVTADARLTLGILDLESGLQLVPVLIGLFVVSEIMVQVARAEDAQMITAEDGKAVDPDGNRLTWAEFKRCIPVMIRSSGVGTFIGLMPGIGSSVACFVAYGEERRRAKNKDEWGTGVIEGVAAPESANNAVSGPSMIPLLTLGVPGSTIAAILIGVFIVHGIQVGPSIFQTSRELVFGLMAAGLLGIAAYGIIGYWGAPLIGRAILLVPNSIIYPFIFMTAFVASYSTRSSLFDVGVAMVFGIVGYLMRRFDYSPAAFVIAFVLAKGAEESLRQSLLLSDAGIFIFFERPVALAFIAAGVLVLIWRAVSNMKTAAPAPDTSAPRTS